MKTPVRPPRQRRSEASFGRIVAAARELLAEQGFDQLTVQRLVRRAGSSVGVFYGRFRDKAGLLEHLAQVYAEEAAAEVTAFAAGRSGPVGDLEEEVRAVVAFVAAFHRARAGWIRALLTEARARPEGAVARRMRAFKAMPPGLVRRLGGAAEADVAAGFFLVLAAVRERVVFGEGGAAVGDDGALVELATRAWLAVLAGGAGGSGGAAGVRADLYS